MNLDDFSIIQSSTDGASASLYIGSAAKEETLGVRFSSLKLFCSKEQAVATLSFGENGISGFDLNDPMRARAEVNGLEIDRLSIKRINDNYVTFYATVYEQILDIAELIYNNHETISLAIFDGTEGVEAPSALMTGPFRDQPEKQSDEFPLVEERFIRARINGFYQVCSQWW